VYMHLLGALQARRSMALASRLHVANQAVLSAFMIAAAVLVGTAPALVLARVAYSWVTMGLLLLAYTRAREADGFALPRLGALARQVFRQSPRPYLRFGIATALDKNLSNTAPSIMVQLAGAAGGPDAAGYLSLGLRVLSQLSVLTVGVLENLNAVVPQAVARGDYAALRRNYGRVLAVVGAAALGLYGLLALAGAPLLPLLFGPEWAPVVGVVAILAAYGAVTAIGGNFGVLYRVFNQVTGAILIKLAALGIALPLALAWMRGAGDARAVAEAGAAGMVVLFALSVGMTAIMTLTALRRRAHA
jgi:O-antigen/teichoic acid export membrane protein